MTFRPSNERERGRTDYHAGRLLIPRRRLCLPVLWEPNSWHINSQYA